MEAELKDLKELADKPEETSSSWLELTVVSEQPKELDATVDDFISSLIERVDSG